MANTWKTLSPAEALPQGPETHLEGPDPAIGYRLQPSAGALTYQVQMPGQPPLASPVEVVMGGTRHGLSFLARIHEIAGSPLTPAPLVETRYLRYAPDHRLALSPGFPLEKPANYETALGRVLTPGFEKKCLSCHGQPRTLGSHSESGVGCESCHGPGQAHLAALARPASDKAILNPKKLPVAQQMQPCFQCHAGFSKVQDAMPGDLLISDQVTALSNSQCWRQSEGNISCVNCHNPHQDAPRNVVVARTGQTCLRCHSQTAAPHAALCPVNRQSGCAACHMPESKSSQPFIISDHWIRVHPETNTPHPPPAPEWRSQIAPKQLALRLIVLDDPQKAAAVSDQLHSGASFFDLARTQSLDRASALNGGYLGELSAGDLDPAWSRAALALQPGEVSGVIQSQGKCFLIGRLPRNYREDAEARFNHAMDLRKSGDRQQSVSELVEALKIYPHLLRALTYLGLSYGEAGNPQTAAAILRQAIRYFPQDAGAHFNLAIADGALASDEEITEYKKALEIDPDYAPAYLNWGAALYAKGRYDEAIDIYRQGIAVNPLIAALHWSLSLALDHQGKTQEAQAESTLAQRIDPKLTGR